MQAYTQQVTHFIHKSKSYCETWITGEPQISHLHFKCNEGEVALSRGHWPFVKRKMIEPCKQFRFTATFKCHSVEDYDEGVGEEEDYVYDKPEREEEVDDNMQE